MSVTWPDIMRFLRSVSRQALTPAHTDCVLAFAKQNVPWKSVIMLADMEGVSGLLYRNMEKLGMLGRLPQETQEDLQKNFSQTRALTLAILEESEKLSNQLEQANLRAVALQGLSVVSSVYEEPGLRRLGDADLLVKSGHKEQLRALLLENGYRLCNPAYPDILCRDRICFDIHGHILNLERIAARRHLFPEDLSSFWQRATPFLDASGGLLRPDPYDNLVALAAHALKHSYSRLFWLVDIHELLLKLTHPNTGWDTGWQEITARAAFWRQERIVLYALLLVEKMFGLAIPLWVKNQLGLQRLTPWEKYLLRLRLKGVASGMVCNGLWLANVKRTRDKIRLAKETIFPKEAVMTQVFLHDSRNTKTGRATKRLVQAIQAVGRDLNQALRTSLRPPF